MKILRSIMLFWAYFIGLGALLGSVMMFIDPTGVMWDMEPLLPILKKGLPGCASLFDDFIASGIVLFVVVGLPNAISVVMTHKGSKYAVWSNLFGGTMLLLWIGLEFYVWGFESLSIVYLIFGVLQVICACLILVKTSKCVE